MAMRDELDRLVEEMITKGIRYEEAHRELSRKLAEYRIRRTA